MDFWRFFEFNIIELFVSKDICFFHEPLPSHFMPGGAQTKTSLAVNVNFQLRTKGSTSTPQETWIVKWKLPRYMGYIHFFWICFRISHVSIPNPMYICDLGHLLR